MIHLDSKIFYFILVEKIPKTLLLFTLLSCCIVSCDNSIDIDMGSDGPENTVSLMIDVLKNEQDSIYREDLKATFNNNSTSVDAGIVEVDGIALQKSNQYDSVVDYNLPDDFPSILGKEITISASGNKETNFYAFNRSFYIPKLPNLQIPDSISQDEDLEIIWEKDPKYEGKIKIMLLVSPKDNEEISFEIIENLEDSGSYIVPSSTLEKIKANSILGIFVSRFSIIQSGNRPLVRVIYDISEVKKSKITKR